MKNFEIKMAAKNCVGNIMTKISMLCSRTELFLGCQHHELPVLQLAIQSDHQIVEPYLSVVWTPVMIFIM